MTDSLTTIVGIKFQSGISTLSSDRLAVFFILIFFFISTPITARDLKNIPGQDIRVGVFPNPPVAFKDEQGQWRGISVDVLQAIADENGWKLEFIENSFSGLLKDFKNKKIDILSMMAYSDKRAQKYTYSKAHLISNWGLVYSRPYSNISSLLDLEGKRVGVMKNNIHAQAFRELVKKFNLNIKIVELPHNSDVMKSVQKSEVDAGVANRLFGALNANRYHLVETGIIFNPINIHYSSLNPNNKIILDVIDKKLLAYKANKNSIYFSSLQRWLNQNNRTGFSPWLIWLAIGLSGFLIVVLGVAGLLKHRVAIRTHELELEINERREAERKLDELAYYDALTKLPNRISLSEHLKVVISSAARKKNKVAILFIDIDRFKTINDTLGHDAGDQLIAKTANRLQSCIRNEDSIHRFGGDEFVAVLQDITDLKNINYITKRMLHTIKDPIKINSTEIFSSVCIGVSLYPDDSDNTDNLLKYADAAMYHAKDQGGNNCQFYSHELTQRIQNRLEIESRLRHAIENSEFQLHYQPIYKLQDQTLIGVEALIRWQDPKYGLIMPDNFIPLAEETGLIIPIGEWVLKQACKQVVEWESQGLGELHLAINVSSKQFDYKKFYSNIISTLKSTGLAARRLELEITERMFLNITGNVKNTLGELTRYGVKFSIDDFGTGYSSLSYLKQLPIETLKIDRSFITGIPEDKDDVQIAATIVAMAHGLGMDVVAEGIETEQQLHYLNSLNCGRGQGYFLSEPQPAENITQLLKQSAEKS